jgi:hypothetical protein
VMDAVCVVLLKPCSIRNQPTGRPASRQQFRAERRPLAVVASLTFGNVVK